MKEMTYKDSIKSALYEEMMRDENIVLFGIDATHGGMFSATKGLYEHFDEKRIKNTPISQSAVTGLCMGASLCGIVPVMEIVYSDFITMGMEFVINQAAKYSYMHDGRKGVNIVIRVLCGVKEGFSPNSVQSLESLYCHVPGVKVVFPSTATDAKGLLKAAIREDNPVIFFEDVTLYDSTSLVPEDDNFVIDIGSSEVKIDGKHISVFTYGSMLEPTMQAVYRCKQDGIDVEVINLNTIYPLDKKSIISSVIKTGRTVIVNCEYKSGGIASEVSAIISESEAFDYLDSNIVRVAIEDTFIPYSKELRKKVIPSVDRIYEAIYKSVNN